MFFHEIDKSISYFLTNLRSSTFNQMCHLMCAAYHRETHGLLYYDICILYNQYHTNYFSIMIYRMRVQGLYRDFQKSRKYHTE